MKIFFFGALSFFICFSQPKNSRAQALQTADRVNGWSADIDTMLSLMKREHYVYRSKPLPSQVVVGAAKLKTEIAVFSDERMLLEMERLMFYMHDGHSYILPVARKFVSYYLPVQFYIFSDGIFIIDAEDAYKDLIGCKVLSIQGVAIEKLVADMDAYVHQDNKFTVKWFAPSILRFRGLYEAYGVSAGSTDVSMDLINQKNQKLSSKISYMPATSFHGIPKMIASRLTDNIPAPLYLSNVPDNFWYKMLPDNKTFYFQFNQVEDKSDESLASFAQRLDNSLVEKKPRLLIIDVRHNNGGNLDLLPPLMSAIKKFEHTNPKSKIIVITGRNTFSAAQVFIAQLNRDTHAIFAGEPSSSSPNFVGEGNYISLPWSGAMGSISNRYHETIPGDARKWIEPEFPVYLSSKEYFKNQDPVMDFILKK